VEWRTVEIIFIVDLHGCWDLLAIVPAESERKWYNVYQGMTRFESQLLREGCDADEDMDCDLGFCGAHSYGVIVEGNMDEDVHSLRGGLCNG